MRADENAPVANKPLTARFIAASLYQVSRATSMRLNTRLESVRSSPVTDTRLSLSRLPRSMRNSGTKTPASGALPIFTVELG